MTTTRGDLLAMAATLRKALGTAALGTGAGAQAPVPDSGWRARWPDLAGLGIAAFCVAPECDGFGGEAPAALMAARELGAALHGSPYPAVVAVGYALSRWLPGDLRQQVAEGISSGALVPAMAFLSASAIVTDDARGPRVNGRARLVAGAASADGSAHAGASAGADAFLALPAEGDALMYVHRDDACAVDRAHELDVTRAIGDVTFDGALAVPLTAPPGGRELVERLHGLLLAGDALGGLDRMLDRTVGYAKERTTFGRAIGGYQAVQHRLVDHAVRLRGMSLLTQAAARALAPALLEETALHDEAARRGAVRGVLLAEAAVAAGALPLLHDLVQLTGAIGFTWEYGLHLYERRAHLDARLGRNPRRARSALAVSEGWT